MLLEDFDPDDDHLLQLDRAGDTLEVRCWSPCEAMPEAPAISAEDARYLEGFVGISYTSFVSDPAARGVFRFFEVSDTKIQEGAAEADCAGRFRRGECNDDGEVDLSDAVCLLDWQFLGGPAPGCLAATNTNGDRATDIADAVWLLNFLFLGGPPPVAPFAACGPGSSELDATLGCATPPKSC